ELIDHAVEKHGKKVKFLTFREALDRINRNLLAGHSLRKEDGSDSLIRTIDLDNDGFLDVVIPESPEKLVTRVWNTNQNTWIQSELDHSWKRVPGMVPDGNVQFGALSESGSVVMFSHSVDPSQKTGNIDALMFDAGQWKTGEQLRKLMFAKHTSTSRDGIRIARQFRDLDGDGTPEFLSATEAFRGVLRWNDAEMNWETLSISLPENLDWLTPTGTDAGLRFVDVNEDGHDDIIFSNHARYGVWLWKDLETGWSIEAISGKRGENPPEEEIPMIVREDGTNNGAWFHSKHMWVQNEDTAELPNLVDRRSFEWLVRNIKE
ncbi:MAG TPA: VCBS repeat-containing protein, partial [Planctomycetaceae bacterium]|nr:VCBS repeat-containing protein [Planctomycetaceae bacterium]